MHPNDIGERLRPSILPTPVANLLRMTFPNAGTFGATANLGIAWANPSNHGVLLGPLNGIDFQNGCSYVSTNLRDLEYQDLRPSMALSLLVVDANGNDLYTIGATNASQNGQLQLFSTITFSIAAGSAPGAGIRGQLTIAPSSGSVTVRIPSPVVFFGG